MLLLLLLLLRGLQGLLRGLQGLQRRLRRLQRLLLQHLWGWELGLELGEWQSQFLLLLLRQMPVRHQMLLRLLQKKFQACGLLCLC